MDAPMDGVEDEINRIELGNLHMSDQPVQRGQMDLFDTLRPAMGLYFLVYE